MDRFTKELGYTYVHRFPIFEHEGRGAPVMYYMIHATDHDAAPDFMSRAYNAAVIRRGNQEAWPWRPRQASRKADDEDTASYTEDKAERSEP